MRFEVLLWSGPMLDIHSDPRDVPVVVLDVAPSDSLAAIAKNGQQSQGVNWPFAYMHFVTAPDTDGRRYQVPYLSPYLADDGALTWTRLQLEGVLVADVIRTAEAGLFQGDRLALLVEKPVGGDGVPPVAELEHLLATIGQIYGGIQGIVVAAKGLMAAIEASQKQWRIRHATPPDVIRFVLQRDAWDYPTLARWLGVSFDTVIQLLISLGFVQDSIDGRTFSLSESAPEAVIRHEIEKQVLYGNPREMRRSFLRAQGRDPDDPLRPLADGGGALDDTS